MIAVFDRINAMLQLEDIEGYIVFGAPTNEYNHEAELIENAIMAMPINQRTEQNILKIIVKIWQESFELNEEEILLRMNYLQEIARNVSQETSGEN